MKTHECYDTGLLLFFFCKSLLAWCPESEPTSMNSGSPSGCSSARVIRAHRCFACLYGFQIFPLLLSSSQQLIKRCVFVLSLHLQTLTVSAFNPDVLHSLDFNVKICNLTINCIRCNFKKSSQSKTVFLLTASSRQKRSGFNRSLKSVTMINTLLIDFQSQSF